MDYYFKTEKLSVGYKNKPLIENIDIGLNKGEILTLIGPNGAGKSTILRSISKQLKLIDGLVFLDKDDLSLMTATDLSKRMAVVFTEKIKSELMTCEDIVTTGRYPYTGQLGILTEEDRLYVSKAMDMVHVTSIKDRDFSIISDGQRQRVMLARAICQNPDIIVLDEPTSFLDIKHKLEFLSVLQELRTQKGLTVIMSLHELELAERVSDKILCVNGEYVDRFGTPEEIFKSGYIKSLFGIKTGTYDEEYGNMELNPPTGDANTFVIAGGGSGKNIYRKLQREQTAFITGIIYDNDLDYPVAYALASDLISAKAFEPIDDNTFNKAKKMMDNCDKVICCKDTFGSFDNANKKLIEYAKSSGKNVEMVNEVKA